ncbi:bifunctional lysylphosphatidylglycerol synthetase/lysine--tRNA ligase LysX [Rhizomonospora bruguierae]|uniref:bifunctional lysylphosphatidylglycerol synthetase/lysine--tRNA ligase LysX n=1 Tax=Rhizomonospora bruguierae TaxID=1581705 RepID=UPI0020BDA82F|nr:bifunctional lysylphosphatidylglycerol synthetase/lysine--tRNA ligase LysX [Micromonospora sp. NBRC 107566]
MARGAQAEQIARPVGREEPPHQPRARGHGGWQRQVPRIFATLLRVTAAVCAMAAIGGAFRPRFQPVRATIDATVLPAPQNLGYALFLVILAAAVSRRKRVAWRILVAYLTLQGVGGALSVWALIQPYLFLDADRDDRFLKYGYISVPVSLLVTALALTTLIIARREFHAKVQRASFWKATATLVGLLGGGLLVGWALVRAFPGEVPSDQRLPYAVNRVFGGAFTMDWTRGGEAPGWVNLLLGLFGAVALFAAVLALFRAQRAAAVLPPEDERRIRGLLAEHGDRDSLGYFATRRDKLTVFSPSGKAALTYRPVVGVSLASGDPLGDPEAWGPAIEAWLTVTREFAWTPAVMGASEAGATAYRRAGLHVLEIGDEAVLNVREFGLDGRDMRPVRQAVNRVERAGYTCRIRRHAEISAAEMANIISLADRWRDTETERGFSMALGRLGDPADGDCVLVEAIDAAGREAALLSFTPWGRTGISLDLMRRDRAADNGLMEFMVAALMRQAPALGVERVSLNFAVFRSAFEEGARIGAGPVLRAWRGLLLFLSHWWQLESLYRSNVKYRPHWEPRFLCFRERRELVKIAVGSAIAEGFLSVPSLPKLFRRGRTEAGRPVPVVTHPEPITVEPAAAVPALAAAPTPPLPGAAVAPAAPPEQVRVRLEKLARIRAAGIDPYPVCFPRTDHCGEIAARHPDLPPDTRTGERVTAAGRVILLRDHGRLSFATIRDWTGDLQVMVSAKDAGDEAFQRWRSDVDLGDHVGVTGEVVTSHRGELSILATEWTMTAKCLQPLPDKHRGLTDPEARVRQRYLDLAVSPAARALLTARSAAVHSLRASLTGRGFIEVETPILQPVHGGANARPFRTHSNAYDLPLYLRIAPELYLKRLAVGGVERVFELGRTFRNEGVSVKHNPEFTILEAYQAYADYRTMMTLTRELIQAAATAVHGAPLVRHGDAEYDVSGRWPAMTVNAALSDALGEEVSADTGVEHLRELADRAGVPWNPAWGRGALVLELYERLVEERTKVPTFYLDFPTDVSPLTRQHRSDQRLAERWDLVAFGTELGTAYSELVDPVEQRRRLTEQSLLAAGGDPEAMELDEDFLHALGYAMPPTGGLGIGVDRVVMLITGRGIRETLPFPLVRPASSG